MMLHIKPSAFCLAEINITGIMCENCHAKIRSHVPIMSTPILTKKSTPGGIIRTGTCLTRFGNQKRSPALQHGSLSRLRKDRSARILSPSQVQPTHGWRKISGLPLNIVYAVVR